MTTRNQKKKASQSESAKLKPTPSTLNGVDSQIQPIVALPASNPPSEKSLDAADNMNSYEKQPETPSILKASSSSPLVQTATRPVRNTTSNPVVKAICALKSGELKVVSPAVSKYFGFPAGPVENLDFSDPKVAEFFNVPVLALPEKLDTAAAASGLNPGVEIAANMPISSLNLTQKSSATVSQADLSKQGNSNSMAAVRSGEQDVGGAARPLMAAVIPPSCSHTSTAGGGSSKVLEGNTARPSGAAVNHASWVGLFKNNRVRNEDTILTPNFVGVTSEKVILDDDDLDDDGEEKRSLIGFFNGKFPGIDAIQRIVDDWSRKCTFYRHNSGWLVFTFDEVKDCETVLMEGPYYAFNKPLVLKKMPEFFDFSDEAYSTAPVWIQLPNLPLRAWKKTALEKICSFLGTPLHLDQVTKDKNRKSFARCLVEMDVSKELPNLVCCDLPRGKFLRQHVLYEETPTFCSNCKKLGHESEDCYAKNNGVPSLYVARSKKDKGKQNSSKQASAGAVKHGKAAGTAPGSHVSGQPASGTAGLPGQPKQGSGLAEKGSDAAPFASGATAAAGQRNDKASGPVSKPNDAAGNLDGRVETRQPNPAPKASAMKNNNGKTMETSAKDPGLVSANSFGPLANEKVGNWSDEVEASNARANNNNKKNNGKKK